MQGFAPVGFRQTIDATNWAGSNLGMKFSLPDRDPQSRSVANNSGSQVDLRVVKNTHSTILTAGMGVKWDSEAGSVLNNVVPCGANEVACGFVDPYLPATGVPVNHACCIVVYGPTSIQKTAADIATMGLPLVTGAAGQVLSRAVGAANDKDIGYAMETSLSTSAGTLVRAFVRCE